MSVLLLTEHIKNYRKILKRKNATIGSILKHHRCDMNLTLEEVADGICSVSYLSKVEHSQIVPSKKILPNLIEKLKVEEIDLFEEETTKWVEKVMTEELVPLEILKQSINKNDYRSKLIKYAFEVLNNKDYIKAKKYYIDLTTYFSHFSEEEMCFFIFLLIKVSYNSERYADVITLSKELDYFDKNKQVIIQSNYYHLKSIYKLGIDVENDKFQDELIEKLIDYNEIERLINVRNYYLAYQAKSLNTKQLEDKISIIKNIEETNKNYALFSHHYFKNMNHFTALKYIRNIKDESCYFYTMYIITLHQTKKEDELLKVLKNPPLNLKKSYEVVRQYLLTPQEDKVDYIRSSIIHGGFITQERIILDFLYTESHKTLKDRYLYKETVSVLEKYNNILKQTSSAIM